MFLDDEINLYELSRRDLYNPKIEMKVDCNEIIINLIKLYRMLEFFEVQYAYVTSDESIILLDKDVMDYFNDDTKVSNILYFDYTDLKYSTYKIFGMLLDMFNGRRISNKCMRSNRVSKNPKEFMSKLRYLNINLSDFIFSDKSPWNCDVSTNEMYEFTKIYYDKIADLMYFLFKEADNIKSLVLNILNKCCTSTESQLVDISDFISKDNIIFDVKKL